MKVELSGQLLLFKSLLISRYKFQISTFFRLLTSDFGLLKPIPLNSWQNHISYLDLMRNLPFLTRTAVHRTPAHPVR